MGRVSDAKQRLMGAIAELIWTGSYGTTTIDQICEKAGVKKGSFYYFFQSKCDLAAAALEIGWAERKPHMDARYLRWEQRSATRSTGCTSWLRKSWNRSTPTWHRPSGMRTRWGSFMRRM